MGITLKFGWRGDMVATSGAEIASGWIPGTPAGQPRGRHVRGRVVSWAAASRTVVVWRARVVRELRGAAERLEGPLQALHGHVDLGVSLRFVFPTTDRARHGQAHTSKPDADNLAKLWLDVAKDVGLLLGLDDSAVAGLESYKVWGAVGGVGWTMRALERVDYGTDRVAAGRWWETEAMPDWLGPDGVAWNPTLVREPESADEE